MSFMSATEYSPHKQDTDLNFSITSNFATNCTLSTINSPDGLISINQLADVSGQTFSFNIDGGNYSSLGVYCHNIVCTDGVKITTGDICREVTPSGKSISGSKVSAYIILFFFLLFIILGFYYTTRNINYEKWNQNIINKYESRNIVRVILSSIGYNIMKNSFIWYYLFGLPIILLITDIAYVFGVESMIYLMQIILGIYYFGILIVAVFFFGYIQEWFAYISDEIKSLDDGI